MHKEAVLDSSKCLPSPLIHLLVGENSYVSVRLPDPPHWDSPLGNLGKLLFPPSCLLPLPSHCLPRKQKLILHICLPPQNTPLRSMISTKVKPSWHRRQFFYSFFNNFSFECSIPFHCCILVKSITQSSFRGFYKSIFTSKCQNMFAY